MAFGRREKAFLRCHVENAREGAFSLLTFKKPPRASNPAVHMNHKFRKLGPTCFHAEREVYGQIRASGPDTLSKMHHTR